MRNWSRMKTLIIDEVSMVEAAFFDYLESIGRQLKTSINPLAVQLVLCGDFLQLPPVVKGDQEAKFCFEVFIGKN